MRHQAAALVIVGVGALSWMTAVQAVPQTGTTAGAAATARGKPPATRAALDRYLRGDFDAAVHGNPMLPRFDIAEADRWVNGGGARSDARRLAAATFTLEYAAARPHQVQVLMPWARAELAAARPPIAAEALWLRATISLSEGLDLWPFLLGRPGDRPGTESHLAFARRRFPNDPYIEMAEALGREVEASKLNRLSPSQTDVPLSFDHVQADVRETTAARRAARDLALSRAASLLVELTNAPPVRAEAHLRLGFVRLRQGQHDAALAEFDQIDGLTAQPGLRYLGHLLAGWALETAGRPDEAETAYRAALTAVPYGQSAAALLTSLLLTHDDLTSAEAFTDEFFARRSSGRDPWQTYFLGEPSEYGTLVARLREAIR